MTYTMDYYTAALAGEKPDMSADHPQPGYYKMRSGKDGPYLPVAIWAKDGELVCRVAGEARDPLKVWTWCGHKPVEKEHAKLAFATGKWPGDVEQPASMIGDNSGALDLLTELRDYMEVATSWLDKVETIKNDEDSDKASNFANHIIKLKGKADAEREEIIAPHLKAQRDTNEKYNPVIKKAVAEAARLKAATTPYLKAKQDELDRIAREKYEAELRAVEAAKKANEEQRRKNEADAAKNKTAPVDELFEDRPEVPPAPIFQPQRAVAGGQVGKRVSLHTVVTWEIENYDLVLKALQHHMDVIAAVEKAARALCKAGKDVPGMKRVETQEAR